MHSAKDTIITFASKTDTPTAVEATAALIHAEATIIPALNTEITMNMMNALDSPLLYGSCP